MKVYRFSLVVGMAVLLATTSTALAQREGGRQGRGFGFMRGFGRSLDKVTLLRSEQVRKEIKLSDEQAEKVDEIVASYREAQRELFSGGRGGRDLSQEERAKLREEMTKKREALAKKTEKKIDKALEKEQVKRLNQIILQQEGVDEIASEFAVAALKLDKEKVKKIKGALEARDEKIQELFASMRRGRPGGEGGGERPDFQAMREKMGKLREDAEKAILAMLTEEQKKALEELKGEKFELDRASLRGRGPRGGEAGRGRGRGGDNAGGERRGRRGGRPGQDSDSDEI